MWQKHKMEPWVFHSLPRNRKSFLIASEQIAEEASKKKNKGKGAR